MLYIDFDGVILDTEDLLFEEWRKNPNRHSLPEIEKIKYIQRADWPFILNNSEVMNDSLYYLKHMDPNTSFILTKVHSLTNEGSSKIKWIRRQGIEQSVILVPYDTKKCDVVDAKGNILVDDCLKNLDEWALKKGSPIFFDYDNDNYDSWNQPNVKSYTRIRDLSSFIKK
jgi:hypothetical protein